jgi:hypothetical protein
VSDMTHRAKSRRITVVKEIGACGSLPMPTWLALSWQRTLKARKLPQRQLQLWDRVGPSAMLLLQRSQKRVLVHSNCDFRTIKTAPRSANG